MSVLQIQTWGLWTPCSVSHPSEHRLTLISLLSTIDHLCHRFIGFVANLEFGTLELRFLP